MHHPLRRSAALAAALIALPLAACSTIAEASPVPTVARTCQTQIDDVQNALRDAAAPSAAFSRDLKTAAGGPAAQFASVATEAPPAADAYAKLSAAYNELAGVSNFSYASKAVAASEILASSSGTILGLARSVTTYQSAATPENAATVTRLADTAERSLAAAATAITSARSVYDSTAGGICN